MALTCSASMAGLRRCVTPNYSLRRKAVRILYHCAKMLETPPGFVSSHTAPPLVPGTALAFAFAGAKLVVGGHEDAPAIPLVDELARSGVEGVQHYVGRYEGVDCVAVTLADDAA